MNDSEFLIIGAKGQLGLALQTKYPDAQTADVNELDITNAESVANYNWSSVKTILNAAAFTNVDGAESADGRISAWKVNAEAVRNLTEAALQHNLTLVHISTDYVFEGTQNPHTETEPFSPLGVYGQTKAAGDIIVSLLPKHYIFRTSWVIGDGKNFVRTMLELGGKGINPTVVADQFGRPTFTNELVRAIDHLLKNNSTPGTYDVSNEGEVVSWADLARTVFTMAGYDNVTVSDQTTEDYFASKALAAPRPRNSVFDLSKLSATGFSSRDWHEDLKAYIAKELKQS